MRYSLSLLILACIAQFSSRAYADSFYLEAVKANREIKVSQTRQFDQVLRAQARSVLSGPLLNERKSADTILKPSLVLTSLGTKLVIERYDMGERLSTVEVPELDSVPVAEWDRVCARALRDVVFGNFRRPAAAIGAGAVATR